MSAVLLTHQMLADTLVDAFENITGLGEGRVLREGYADRRPPGGLYCTLWFKNIDPLAQNDGDFEYDTDADTGYQILRNEAYCTLRVSFWGPKAYEAAVEAVSALQNSQRYADLWKIIGFAGIDPVQDISTAYLGKVQPRAYFNFNYYVCLGAKYPADWFNSSKWVLNAPEHGYSQEIIIKEKENGNG